MVRGQVFSGSHRIHFSVNHSFRVVQERNQEVIRWASQSYEDRLRDIEIKEREQEASPKSVVSSYNEPLPSIEEYRSQEEQKHHASQPSVHATTDDAARELEDLADTSTRKSRGKKSAPSKRKRDGRPAILDTQSPNTSTLPATDAALDVLEDELDPRLKRPPTKRKRPNANVAPPPVPSFDDTIDDVALELERIADDPPSSVRGSSPPYSNGIRTPDAPKRKRAPRKKRAPVEDDLLGETAGDGVDDASAGSRTLSNGFYHLDEPIPEPKKGKKVDQLVLARRLVALEDSQRKIWLSIARKDIPKVRLMESIRVFPTH